MASFIVFAVILGTVGLILLFDGNFGGSWLIGIAVCCWGKAELEGLRLALVSHN